MRPHTLALMAALLLIICAFGGSVSAEATISASTATPIPGEQITFTVGTTMEGLEAVINTTGLSYVSNTGLGNSNHVITVPGVGTAYTYTVTAQPGETVSFILSDVREADADGNEREGQRAVWMASAGAAPTQAPSDEPSQNPSGEPSSSEQPSQNPSEQPSQNPSGNPSEQPSGAPGSNPPASEQPTTSGNPSPTVQPTSSDNSIYSNNPGGTVAGNVSGGNSGGTGGAGTSGVPRTGDISHFWALLGILGVLLVIVVVAGKRVFAED